MNYQKKVFIILNDGTWLEHKYKEIRFPSGEYQVRLDVASLPNPEDIYWVDIICSDVIWALQVRNCFEIHYEGDALDYSFTMVYTPFARQDRVCNAGECASVYIILDIIEQSNMFDHVCVLDIHNRNVLNNYHITNLGKDYVFKLDRKRTGKSFLDEYDTFLAPDAGSEQQVKHLANYFHKDFVSCSKERDSMTGKLSGFTLNGSVKDKKVLIVDDLLDAGGTFLGIHSLLSEAEKVSLYTTHGLFTQGVEKLTNVFDHVYCTNSVYEQHEDGPQNLTVIDVITPFTYED